MTRAKLTVTRVPADGLGDQYLISLSLDGESLGSLAPGESISRPLDAGRHRVVASNTLMRKAVELDAGPGDEIRFVTRNRRGPGTTLFAALGAGWLYVGLEREPSNE